MYPKVICSALALHKNGLISATIRKEVKQKPITSFSMHDQSKRLTILTAKEIQVVHGLPQFTGEERDAYFALDPMEKQQLDQFRNITTAVYFVLQLGYFKAQKQFFVFGLQEVSDDVVYRVPPRIV